MGQIRRISRRRSRIAQPRQVAKDLGAAVVDHRLLTYGAAIAFQSLIALVPITLLGLGLLGALGFEDTWRGSVGPAVGRHVTRPVYDGIDYTVERVLQHDSAGLIAFASVLAIWYLAATMRVIMEALNQIHGVEDHRSWSRRVLTSFALALAVGTCLVGSVLVVIASPRAARHGAAHFLVGAGRWLAAVVLLGVAVALLVRYAPGEQPQKKWASAGSALVIGSWIVASLVFRWFVSSVANFRSPTGSLTGLLVLNGYMLTTSLIFLIGVELDELLRRRVRKEAAGRRTRR